MHNNNDESSGVKLFGLGTISVSVTGRHWCNNTAPVHQTESPEFESQLTDNDLHVETALLLQGVILLNNIYN